VKFSAGMPSAYILAMYALVFAGLPTTTTYKSSIITPLPADYNHTITMSSASSLTGAKLQATNHVPRPVDRGTATRYGG